MKNPIAMSRWIADKTISQSAYEKLNAEEKRKKYPIGIFKEDKERLEYTELYYQHIVPSAQTELKNKKK